MYGEIVVAGVLLAMLYYEWTGYSPGGLVTAAYLALCLTTPVRIFYTLVIVLITYGLLRLLSHVWIIFGRRQFVIAVLITFLLDFVLSVGGLFPFGIRAIGYVVPALLVRDLERQGILATGISLGIVTALLALVMMWAGAL